MEDEMNLKLNSKSISLLFFLSLLILIQAACSGASQPKLIGSYPSQAYSESQPVPREQFVYDAVMEMEVRQVDSAAERSEERADDYGGYLVSRQSWTQAGEKHIQLILAVPAPNYEVLHRAILDLGTLQGERVSGEWVSSRYGDDWSVYSQITVTFHPRYTARQLVHASGWNPIRTFERAWQVFLTIFGVVVDILIWVIVLVGPFILMALGLRVLVRKLWRPR
jgi:hypothetical protein